VGGLCPAGHERVNINFLVNILYADAYATHSTLKPVPPLPR